MGLESLSEAIERLGARGYAHSLRAHDGALRDLETGDLLEPEKLTIEEIVRFEGTTDPDEDVVLFALKGPVGAILHVKVELAAALTDAVTYDFLRVLSPT